MVNKKYIGITGPVNVRETKEICKKFYEAGYSMESSHIPMIGFLISHKTLNNKEFKNRRYPSVNTLTDLLKATDNKVLTMIHYNSKEISTLSNQVERIFEGIYENNLCRAIQLNIPWPDINQVSNIIKKYPDMKIVFQASNKIMNEKTPNQIVQGIKEYGDLVSYVLIDPSGGRGIPFDLESSINIYSELKEHCSNLVLGFAGGFNGKNVSSRLRKIIQKINENDFCIDAEGGLRDKITLAYGDDLLNIKKVSEYIQSSSLILK